MTKTYIMPDGNVYRKTAVTCVSFASLTDYLGVTADEVQAICDYGFSNVSWGDADYTLVNSQYALECIVNGLLSYHDEAGTEPTLSEADLRTKYWEIVERNDYIDMES